MESGEKSKDKRIGNGSKVGTITTSQIFYTDLT
jgi:hypothetical protein